MQWCRNLLAAQCSQWNVVLLCKCFDFAKTSIYQEWNINYKNFKPRNFRQLKVSFQGIHKDNFKKSVFYWRCLSLIKSVSVKTFNCCLKFSGLKSNRTRKLFISKTQAWDWSGAPNDNFRKNLFGGRFDILNFRDICCKISYLPASPRIFEHVKNGIIAHFNRFLP